MVRGSVGVGVDDDDITMGLVKPVATLTTPFMVAFVTCDAVILQESQEGENDEFECILEEEDFHLAILNLP